VPFKLLSQRSNPIRQGYLLVCIDPLPFITIGALEENKDLKVNLLD
jgi:hypothetical protein